MNNDDNPYRNPNSEIQMPESDDSGVPKSQKPVILAVLSLIFWIIPLFGVPISIAGLIITLKLRSITPKRYIISLVLLIVALFLSIVNAGIGAYQGMTGQNKLVNEIMGK